MSLARALPSVLALLCASLLCAVPATATTTAAAPAPARTVVVFVGGLGSSAAIAAATFAPLATALAREAGYAAPDLLPFSYDPSAPTYRPTQTCQSLATSSDLLSSFVRRLRDAHSADGVVLVGHSMGGVVALDSALRGDDLTSGDHPFVRRVVTVDSPLGGLSTLQRSLIADLWLGPCPAASEAAQRYVDPSWPSTLSSRVQDLVGRGVQVVAVANPQDFLLDLDAQQVPGASVNHVLDILDGSLNHTAALLIPAGVAELVRLIGPAQG